MLNQLKSIKRFLIIYGFCFCVVILIDVFVKFLISIIKSVFLINTIEFITLFVISVIASILIFFTTKKRGDYEDTK